MAKSGKSIGEVIVGKLVDGEHAISIALPAKFQLREEAKVYVTNGRESDPCVLYAKGRIGPFDATISLSLPADMCRALGVKLVETARVPKPRSTDGPVVTRHMSEAERATFAVK